MFTIYSDKDIFENIISSPNIYPNWNKIINDHSKIYLDINPVDLDSELDNPDSMLFLFLQLNARDIEIYASDDYFQKIYVKKETIIENPTSVYFLNLSETETIKLKEETGLIISNADKIDDELLLKSVNSHWFAGEIIENNWKSILSDFINYPSNSIIINDRNLFANIENFKGKDQNLGVDNILRILDVILPKKMNIDYHITIQTDHNPKWNGIDNKSKCDGLACYLNSEITKLRPYNFIFEIIFSHSSTQYYTYTHNRRILSNYKTGSVLHGFSVFQLRTPNKTRNDDNLNLNAFFDKINIFSNEKTNLKEHQIGIQRMHELAANCISKINSSGPSDYTYRYYLNGVEVTQGQTTAIKNRLLN
jgi:hypothetical protein